MATHSSVLARRIPGMGGPHWLPSVGSHKVGHDWSDLAAAAAENNRLITYFITNFQLIWLRFTFFPRGSDGKESSCSPGDPPSIPGWGRSPGEGNGYPLQYSCLEISMDTGAWQTTVNGATQSDMTEQLTTLSHEELFASQPNSYLVSLIFPLKRLWSIQFFFFFFSYSILPCSIWS